MRLNHIIHWFQGHFVSFLPFFLWLFPSDVDCKGVTEVPSELVLLEPGDRWALGSHGPVLCGVRGWGGNAGWPGLPLLAEPWSLLFLLNCKEKDRYAEQSSEHGGLGSLLGGLGCLFPRGTGPQGPPGWGSWRS